MAPTCLWQATEIVKVQRPDGPATLLILTAGRALDNKATLRKTLAARRRAAFEAGDAAGERLVEVFLKDGPNVAEGSVVSGFWPIRTEIDIRPLMEALRGRGAVLALPCAPDRLGHLAFRRYDGGPPPAQDAWGIPAPASTQPIVRPDIVLTPLLGFDRRGGRIGYGAGLYDRALNGLRESGPVLAVGVAFAAQEVDEIPREGHDEPLDWVITEAGVKVRPDSK